MRIPLYFCFFWPANQNKPSATDGWIASIHITHLTNSVLRLSMCTYFVLFWVSVAFVAEILCMVLVVVTMLKCSTPFRELTHEVIDIFDMFHYVSQDTYYLMYCIVWELPLTV